MFPCFSQFFHFLLKHIPQLSEKPLYMRVSRQVHVCQTCTYHVPNIYLNMYLRIVFCEVPYTYDKVHDGYMLGICSNNIYPIPNPYVQRLFRRSRYMLTINDTKRPLVRGKVKIPSIRVKIPTVFIKIASVFYKITSGLWIFLP